MVNNIVVTCNLDHRFLRGNLPVDMVDADLKVRTLKEIHFHNLQEIFQDPKEQIKPPGVFRLDLSQI